MTSDFRTKEDLVRARWRRDVRTIWLTVIAIAVIIGYTAIESAYAHTRYGGQDESVEIINLSVTNITDVTNLSVTNITDVTNLSVTNITEVSEITVEDGGEIKMGGGKGKIVFSDLTTDIISIQNALLELEGRILGLPQHWRFNGIDPLALQGGDTQVGVIVSTSAALTITNIKITLDAAGNEVAGDLMYADAFIGFANPVVINVCDTTSGVLDDSSMGTAAVPAGKTVYFQFDSAPHDDITQMLFDVTWDYD